jgi:phage baseplate assembly protein W
MSRTYKLYPEDLEKERAIGVKLPFNTDAPRRPVDLNYSSGSQAGSWVFESTYSTEEQAIYNLINLLLTRKGERFMFPLFGSPIPDFVFEQNTRTNRFQLQEATKSDIAYWMPHIIISDLTVEQGSPTVGRSDQEHAVTINLIFKVTENGANRTIKLFLDSERIDVEVN